MLSKGFRLPIRLAGIPLYVDLSFLIVLPLMVWMTARNLASVARPIGLDPAHFAGLAPLALSVVAVTGLFVSIILHELGHSLTARAYGVKVRRITLWFLGGVAEFEEMPRQRGAEAVVGIAGPIVSFALFALLWGATLVVPPTLAALWLICWYLGAINLMLGLFNLLPALPLDGGRILRSLLALRMPHLKATLVSGTVAKAIALLLGLYGLLTFSPWLMLMAFFIFTAVNSETRYAVVSETLKGVRVTEIMTPNVPIDPWRPLPAIPHTADALDAFRHMGQTNSPALVVVDEIGRPLGVLTQVDLQRAIQMRMAGFRVSPQSPTPVTVTRVPPPTPFSPYPPVNPFGYTSGHAPGDPQRHARSL